MIIGVNDYICRKLIEGLGLVEDTSYKFNNCRWYKNDERELYMCVSKTDSRFQLYKGNRKNMILKCDYKEEVLMNVSL